LVSIIAVALDLGLTHEQVDFELPDDVDLVLRGLIQKNALYANN
jgi:hypothetical protein